MVLHRAVAGGGQQAPPIFFRSPCSIFFPTNSAEYFGSPAFPKQSAVANAPENVIRLNAGGHCAAITNLGIDSFPPNTITFDPARMYLTNVNMNECQPGIVSPIPNTYPLIEVAIRWQSTYRLTPAHYFQAYRSSKGVGNTLRSTWLVPALSYSPMVRDNLMELLRSAGQHPVDMLHEVPVEPFVFEYAIDHDRPGCYISASPDAWYHLIWLEPTFILNHLFLPPLVDGDDCWLSIPGPQLPILKTILDYFRVGHALVEIPPVDEPEGHDEAGPAEAAPAQADAPDVAAEAAPAQADVPDEPAPVQAGA